MSYFLKHILNNNLFYIQLNSKINFYETYAARKNAFYYLYIYLITQKKKLSNFI